MSMHKRSLLFLAALVWVAPLAAHQAIVPAKQAGKAHHCPLAEAKPALSRAAPKPTRFAAVIVRSPGGVSLLTGSVREILP